MTATLCGIVRFTPCIPNARIPNIRVAELLRVVGHRKTSFSESSARVEGPGDIIRAEVRSSVNHRHQSGEFETFKTTTHLVRDTQSALDGVS
jgi:hypothetical protein